jgi:branched-chain amino acid transport system permease protein
MSFVQGDMLTLGGFLGVTLYGTLKLPFAVSVFLVMAAVFSFGYGLEKAVIRRLLSNRTMPIYIVLATIAVSYIVQNGAMLIWGTRTRYFPSIFSTPTVNLLGLRIQTESVFCVGVSLICMVLLHFFMTRTAIGTAMRAASMDAMAAEACGIDVSMTTGLTWGLAAGIAAIGGILVGPVFGVYTLLGASIGRKAFTSAVSGGYGNMYGAIIGGLLLGLLETYVAGYVTSAMKDMVAYITLMAFLFLRPTGILNERAIQD